MSRPTLPVLSPSFFPEGESLRCKDGAFFGLSPSSLTVDVKLPCPLSSITTVIEDIVYHVAIILTDDGSLYVNQKDGSEHFKLLTDKKVTKAVVIGEVILFKDDKGAAHSFRIACNNVPHKSKLSSNPTTVSTSNSSSKRVTYTGPARSESFVDSNSGELQCTHKAFFGSAPVEVRLPFFRFSIATMEENKESGIAIIITSDGSLYISDKRGSNCRFKPVTEVKVTKAYINKGSVIYTTEHNRSFEYIGDLVIPFVEE